jgi:hypothetical protein
MIRGLSIALLVVPLACAPHATSTHGTGGAKGGGTGGAKGAGTGGAKGDGTGGAKGDGTGGHGGTTPGGNSVLERNNHPTRDGHFAQPTLTKAAAATMASDGGFAATSWRWTRRRARPSGRTTSARRQR